MLTMHVSWSLFFLFFFSLLSRAFKKACFEQMLLSILRRLFFDGKWFKNPQTTSRRFFWKKKSLSLKDYKMTPFCASLSKYISCVRIAKWALSNSDFLPIFTSERTEPHPSQVCKFWWKSYEVPLMKGLIVRRFTVYLSSHCSRFLNRQHKARAPYNIQGSRQFEGTGVLLCAIWLKHESFLSVFKFCNWSQAKLRIFVASLLAEGFKHSANSFFPKSSCQ